MNDLSFSVETNTILFSIEVPSKFFFNKLKTVRFVNLVKVINLKQSNVEFMDKKQKKNQIVFVSP